VRADIYALGCTLYFLLVGEVPFPGGTPTEKMLRHSRETIPVPSRAGIPPGVLDLLAKMTARKPEQRFNTPAEVVTALEAFARRAGPPPTPPPLPAVSGSLTVDDLPTPQNNPPVDRRFQLPSAQATPRTKKTGCIGFVLLGAAIGVAVGRLV
jgi:eukaryotic-like serine/threonine-protein kinase